MSDDGTGLSWETFLGMTAKLDEPPKRPKPPFRYDETVGSLVDADGQPLSWDEWQARTARPGTSTQLDPVDPERPKILVQTYDDIMAAKAAEAGVPYEPYAGPYRYDGASLSSSTPHVPDAAKSDETPGQDYDDDVDSFSIRLDRLPEAPPVQWLAKGLIPRAAITVLAGDEAIGKSLWWVLVASYITTGQANPLLGFPARPAGRVLAFVNEDGAQETRARMKAAGADLSRVRVVDDTGETEVGLRPAVSLPRDQALVEREIDGFKPDLVVVDAWLSTVPGNLKVRDPQDARAALAPWSVLARQSGAGILLVAHSNRTGATTVRDRIGATSVLRQVARCLLFAVGSGEGTDRTVTVGADKLSNGRIGHAVTYRLEGAQQRQATPEDDGTTPRLRVVGDSGGTISALLSAWLAEEKVAAKQLSDRSMAVLATVRDTPEGTATPSLVAKVLDLDNRTAGTYLARLAASGLVRKTGRGAYAYNDPGVEQPMPPESVL